jgi:hypothetical protein
VADGRAQERLLGDDRAGEEAEGDPDQDALADLQGADDVADEHDADAAA